MKTQPHAELHHLADHFQSLETCGPVFSKDWKFIVLAAAVAASACGARAATPETELKNLSMQELMAVEIATVTTASKSEEKASDAPATVIVITAKDIKLRGYSTLTDVMRDLPGMETVENYFSEIGTQVPVRGITGNNKIVLLVNGMRVNPPGGEFLALRNSISVRNADRIEVIYGPGSTLYGQDAISCVINVITKNPAQAGGEIGAGVGNNGTRDAWGSFDDVLDKAGKIRLSGFVAYHDSDLTRLDKEYPKWWAPYKALALPRNDGVIPQRQDFGLNEFLRLDVHDTSLQIWDRKSRRSSSESGYPPAYVSEAIWEDESLVIEGRNKLQLSGKAMLESAVTYNSYEVDPSTRYVFSTPDLTNSWFLNDFKYARGESWSVEETVHYNVSEKISLLAGGAASTYDIIPKATIPGGADPDGNLVRQGGYFQYTMPGDPTLHTIQRVNEETYETYAAYGEVDWRIAGRLKLIAGTRITKDTRFDDTPFTPRAALVYNLTDRITTKYIYTRAYVAPAPYFANAVYDNGTLLATSNPDLKPEKAETHEVNVTFAKENLNVGASVYYGMQHDIITVSDFAAPQNVVAPKVYLNGDPSQPRTLVRAANGGDSENYGGDVYGRATFGSVSTWASYSYTDYEENNSGNSYELVGASHHNFRLGLTWAITEKLCTTPSLVLRSTPANIPGGTLEDEMQTPWQINLYTFYQLTAHLDLFADLRNVTDNHYALAGFGNQGQAIPMETFNGEVGVRMSF